MGNMKTNSIIKNNILRICSLILVLIMLCAIPVSAQTSPYEGYNYDAWGNSVAAPVGYKIDVLADMNRDEKLSFSKPSDLFIDNNGFVYISDTGHNRICICDADLNFVREITTLEKDGVVSPLNGPNGLFVDKQNNIYIALPEECRVVKITSEGKFLKEFLRPETDLINKDIEFKPTKVLVNNSETVFALVDGLHLGAIMYDQDGIFTGFYGASEVVVTASLIVDYYWKKIMSQEQSDKMARYVPVQFANFAIDEENFIYTCTNDSAANTGEIRKLNAGGSNVLAQRLHNVESLTGNFGDLERTVYKGQVQDTTFVDIAVSDEGFIFALDKFRGRIFEYDQESKLLNVFGAIGYQKGSFQNPIAIDTYDGKVYVLDEKIGKVSRFNKTKYGVSIEKAVVLYNKGLFSEAKTIWEDVLLLNNNCELAYAGMGKALYEEGDYKAAMEHFRLGYDRTGYSRAFKEYRLSIIRVIFPYIITLVLVLLVVFLIWQSLKKKKPSDAPKKEKPLFWQMFFHPTIAFQEMKYHKSWNLKLSSLILLLWFIASVFEKQLTDFKFNYTDTSQFNVIYTFLGTVGLFAVWSILNWAVAALMEGKGTMKEIWVASSYALVPYVVVTFIKVLLSHLLIADESMFITIIVAVGFLWSALLIIDALHVIHEYSIIKTLASIVIILLGIVFVMFLCVLLFGLVEQFVSFFKMIYFELSLR